MVQELTDWRCSICGQPHELSMVQATIICMKCLDEIKKQTQQSGTGLQEEVIKTIKENDIYD